MSLLEGYRLFTGYYVAESDLPSAAKLEFVRFIKEATQDDIIDILSGQYEGVEGLSEEEVSSLHDFLVEAGFGAALKGAKAAAGRFGKAAASKAGSITGWKQVGQAASRQKKIAAQLAKKRMPAARRKALEKAAAGAKSLKRAAITRAAIKTGALGAAGGSAYMLASGKRPKR